METFSRPPPHGSSDCADPEASWGHRSGGGPGQDSELFFGYYASAATMMREEHGPAVPELARRMTVSSCHADPARALVPVLTAHARRTASRSATSSPTPATPTATPAPGPSRSATPAPSWSRTCTPHDRGPRGTHHGAIIANGNLYCPATPRPLLELGPLARDATPEQVSRARHRRPPRLARHKLGRITADDADGYHRVMCPAAMGKIRCPLRPASMTLTRDRPEILTPPEHPPACCTQQTITVPPQVAPRPRRNTTTPRPRTGASYARRTGAERTFSTAKDPASNNIARGWCRLMGLTPLMLWLACLLAVRNQRILTAWNARQARQRPPRRRRPAPQNPPPAPQDPRQPGHRSAATLTRHANPAPPTGTPSPPRPRHRTSRPCPEQPRQARQQPETRPRRPPHAEMSDPNVKISAGQT